MPEISYDENNARELWRGGRVIDKATFLLNAREAGLISTAEMKKGARGEWIDTFVEAIDAITEGDFSADEQEVLWGTTDRVVRASPFIEIVRRYKDFTPEQIDDIFGWPD